MDCAMVLRMTRVRRGRVRELWRPRPAPPWPRPRDPSLVHLVIS